MHRPAAVRRHVRPLWRVVSLHRALVLGVLFASLVVTGSPAAELTHRERVTYGRVR